MNARGLPNARDPPSRKTPLDGERAAGYVPVVSDPSGAGRRLRGNPPASKRDERAIGGSGIAALIAACGVGLLLRCLAYHSVFAENGDVLLGLDDAQFHARRALYSFVNFPAVLDFDWFLAYPDGAPSPVPPFFDWATAGVARLFGNDTRTLETVAAWVSPIAGALLVWPAYAIGRSVATRGVGLGAAWLSAVLPSGILITRLGNFDHHGAVALIAAGWLASCLSCVGRSGRTLVTRSALQAVMITLMLFTWSGSLLYLALGAGAELAAIVLLHGRTERLLAMASSLIPAAFAATLWLSVSATPLGGAFSSQTLSWLHVVALLGIAIPTLLLALWEHRQPSADAESRIVRLVLLAAAIGLPLLALPALREQLLQGLFFLAQQDDWAATNPEQLSLFHSTDKAARAAVRFGLFGYLVPLLPFYLGWCAFRSREREKLLVLLFWVAALSLLLLSQVRYGTDFTVPGAVVFAMMLGDLRHELSRWLPARLATASVAAGVGISLFPAFTGLHQRSLTRLVVALSDGHEADGRTRRTSHAAAVHFGKQVRDVTPEVGGFLEPGVRPKYGILVSPHLGHRFTYSARRPVPSNNLGPYLDPEKYQLAKKFYHSRLQATAVKVVDALEVRYVMTTARDWARPSFADQLHVRNESSFRGRPTSGRFRLVTASRLINSRSDRSAAAAQAQRKFLFKLFEVVAGAVLVVEAKAGEEVWAEIQLSPQWGRSVPYKTVAKAGADGVARLRVPYATRQEGAVATPGPWRVRTRDRAISYEVSEADVGEGREVHASTASRRLPSETAPDSPH